MPETAITFRCASSLKRRIRLSCAHDGVSMTEFLLAAVECHLKRLESHYEKERESERTGRRRVRA